MQRVNGIVQVRPEIAGIEDYIPGESLEAFSARTGVPVDRLIKLNSNESPYPPSPRVARAFGAFENYNLYPDPDGRALTADISAYVGVAPEHIVLSSGSNELITKLWSAFLAPGESVLLCSPTFSLYTTATTLASAKIVDAPRTDSYEIDVDAIRAALREDTKLIVLCSPNNPTGNLVARADVVALLDTGRIVVVDEAYIEFAGDEALAESPITLAPQYPNLVVLRTFSKWAGLAGLRLGYGAFPTWLTGHIRKLQLPFEVNLAAHIAAHETLADLPLMRARVATLMEERDRLFELLRAQPYLRAFPSKGNFILAELTDPRLTLAELRASMEAAGIILRYFRTPDLARHVRITVGTAEHTAALARVLTSVGARLAAPSEPAAVVSRR
ncbi:MAG TPA: histidinol-phosphate transaminase [Ktedonobacterales bacterium]|nr:histidinol-phosphate transaminase [Ktedonobacterales bacterium]